MTMKKLTVCFLAAFALFAMSAPASAAKTVEMKISHLGTEQDPVHLGWLLLKKNLEEKSKGQFKVTIFPNKILSNSNHEDVEKVQQNIVQMTSAPTSSMAAIGNIDEYKIFDYPYLFHTTEDLYTIIDGPVGKEIGDKLLKAVGVKPLGGFSIGWCCVSTNKGRIKSPADLKGQKIRTISSDLHMEIIRGFSGSPIIVNYGETFTALQQGTVDGMQTAIPLYVADRFYEVQKYMGLPYALAQLHIPVVNAAWYNALSPELKKIYDECIPIYLEAERKFQAEAEAAAIKTLKERGMIIDDYTPEQKKLFIDSTAYILKDKAGIAGKEIIERVQKILGW